MRQSPRPQSRLIIVYYSETEKEKKKNQSSNLSFLDVRFSFLESLELYF